MITNVARFKDNRHDLISEALTIAVGQPADLVCPPGLVYEIVSAKAKLTTSGVAGDRYVFLSVVSGTNEVEISSTDEALAATGVNSYHFGIGIMPYALSAVSGLKDVFVTLPCCVEISAGETFRISAFNLDAGDQFSEVIFRYKKWYE